MKKLIRPQDILLMTLAGIGDIFEELRDPFMIMGSAYKSVYGFVPSKYKRNNFLKSVQRSLRTGYIEKIEKEGEVYLRLTSVGSKKVHRDFAFLSLANKSWDKKWRIVFFDIEEVAKSMRERLRGKLKELGFAMLQRSVWITPHDLSADFHEFLEFLKIENRVFIIEGEALLAGDAKELAWRLWKLDILEDKYTNLDLEIGRLKQLAATPRDRNNKQKIILDIEKLKKRIKGHYLNILLYDPCLPKELLPNNWIGHKVKREVKNL